MKYFDVSEFDQKGLKGSGAEFMCKDFLKLCDELRGRYGKPLKVNSGYRSEAYNKEIGGVKNSSHTKVPCKAADFAISSSADRWKFIKCCFELGITRIGIGNSFIHIDIDYDKPTKLIWDYYKGANKTKPKK
jgi:uncharacterized protein YcbK (DUF882 family)